MTNGSCTFPRRPLCCPLLAGVAPLVLKDQTARLVSACLYPWDSRLIPGPGPRESQPRNWSRDVVLFRSGPRGCSCCNVVCPNPLGVLFSWGCCPFLTGVVEVHFLPCLDHHHELGETGRSQRPLQIPGSALHLRGSMLALWVSCLPSTPPDPHPRLAQPEATCLCSGWSRGLWTAGATPRASTELEAYTARWDSRSGR